MKIDVATLFPEAFDGLKVGIIAKALQKELFSLSLHNIRDYSADKHRRCDDYPFGGGAGMLMTPQPLRDCIRAVDPDRKSLRIYMSPKGAPLTQSKVERLARCESLLIVCGAYEGIDQDNRFRNRRGALDRRLRAHGGRTRRHGRDQRRRKVYPGSVG